MSGIAATQTERPGIRVPLWLQVAAWVAGIVGSVAGMLDLVAEWSPTLATIQLVVLVVAPVLFMLEGKKRPAAITQGSLSTTTDWTWCVLLGLASFGVCFLMGRRFGELPPAYHDEFSYLFQAKTLLAGHFSFPSSPVHPELFDQMHVLNEGRMASRYYPGTGLWLAPFVAIGHPFLGQCVAGMLATMLVYWVGRELSGRACAVISAAAMAGSPGIGLFGNTLLAHQPTLLGLAVFVLGVTRWRRTRSAVDAWIAGAGLSYAMLCRPMTAAAVGLPFGIDVALWLAWPRTEQGGPRQRLGTIIGFGVPLLIGWGVMLGYNHSVTGQWLTSPYQLYTDIYTPRHVYGFNNVLKGEQRLGPKVIVEYDRWAANLTPELAAQNALTRWLGSWLWTLDVVPLLMCAIVILGVLWRVDRRWGLLVAAIASLHLLHLPYWYAGIMGWHYVFESSMLWCVVLGGVSALLFTDWSQRGRRWLSVWWVVLIGVSLGGAYLAPVPEQGKQSHQWEARVQRGLNSMKGPRKRHQEMRRWVESQVDRRPALVLVDQKSMETHLDLVVNDPGLGAEILMGRYRAGTDLKQIQRDFPDRHVYVVYPSQRVCRRVE